jgi:methionine synthase II (cobalamin-independent)
MVEKHLNTKEERASVTYKTSSTMKTTTQQSQVNFRFVMDKEEKQEFTDLMQEITRKIIKKHGSIDALDEQQRGDAIDQAYAELLQEQEKQGVKVFSNISQAFDYFVHEYYPNKIKGVQVEKGLPDVIYKYKKNKPVGEKKKEEILLKHQFEINTNGKVTKVLINLGETGAEKK